MRKLNILFICKGNRFRSQLAEGFFNKFNKNSYFKAKSAGIIKGNPTSKQVKELSKKLGIKINKSPRSLTSKLLKWRNILIIVADDVPPSLFKDNKNYNKKLLVWRIQDDHTNRGSNIFKISNIIKNKVINLIKNLK